MNKDFKIFVKLIQSKQNCERCCRMPVHYSVPVGALKRMIVLVFPSKSTPYTLQSRA